MKLRMQIEPRGDQEQTRLVDTSSDPANARPIGTIIPTVLGEQFQPQNTNYSLEHLEEIVRIMKMGSQARHDEQQEENDRRKHTETPNN